MNTEQIIKEIEKHLATADKKGATDTFCRHLEGLSDFEKSRKAAEILYKQYTNFRSGMIAMLMEGIIRNSPNIAQVNFPENFLFKLCVITGSKDLYECFVEEAVEPYLENKSEDEIWDYYTELSIVAKKLNDHFFSHYEPYKKGIHYNSALPLHEENRNELAIHREDYVVMEEIIENYNRIIGRRDIINALEEKMDIDKDDTDFED